MRFLYEGLPPEGVDENNDRSYISRDLRCELLFTKSLHDKLRSQTEALPAAPGESKLGPRKAPVPGSAVPTKEPSSTISLNREVNLEELKQLKTKLFAGLGKVLLAMDIISTLTRTLLPGCSLEFALAIWPIYLILWPLVPLTLYMSDRHPFSAKKVFVRLAFDYRAQNGYFTYYDISQAEMVDKLGVNEAHNVLCIGPQMDASHPVACAIRCNT
jgi:hypothetical protein